MTSFYKEGYCIQRDSLNYLLARLITHRDSYDNHAERFSSWGSRVPGNSIPKLPVCSRCSRVPRWKSRSAGIDSRGVAAASASLGSIFNAVDKRRSLEIPVRHGLSSRIEQLRGTRQYLRAKTETGKGFRSDGNSRTGRINQLHERVSSERRRRGRQADPSIKCKRGKLQLKIRRPRTRTESTWTPRPPTRKSKAVRFTRKILNIRSP